MVLRGYPEDPAGPFSREERGSRNLRGTDIIFTSFFLCRFKSLGIPHCYKA